MYIYNKSSIYIHIVYVRGRKREREQALPSGDSLPTYGQELGVENSVQVFAVGGRNSLT